MITRSKAQKKNQEVQAEGPLKKPQEEAKQETKKTKRAVPKRRAAKAKAKQEDNRKNIVQDASEWAGRLRNKPDGKDIQEPEIHKNPKAKKKESKKNVAKISSDPKKKNMDIGLSHFSLLQERLQELRVRKEALLAQISEDRGIFGLFGSRSLTPSKINAWLEGLRSGDASVIGDMNSSLSIAVAEGSVGIGCLGNEAQVRELVEKLLMVQYPASQKSLCIKNVLMASAPVGARVFIEAGGLTLINGLVEKIEFIDVLEGWIQVLETISKKQASQSVLNSGLPERLWSIKDFFDMHNRARIARILSSSILGSDIDINELKTRFVPIAKNVQETLAEQQEEVARELVSLKLAILRQLSNKGFEGRQIARQELIKTEFYE